jgi:ABC-2 type transport system permease protein
VNGVATVRLIAAREVRQRLRSRAFFVVTAILCLLVIGIGVMRKVLDDDSIDHAGVVLVGDPPPMLDRLLVDLGRARGVEVTSVAAPDRAGAERLLTDGDADAAIIVADRTVLFDDHVRDTVAQVVDAAWGAAEARAGAVAAGVPADDVDRVLSPPPLSRTVIDAAADDDVGKAVGTIAAVLLFGAINAFGGYVLTGVVEEKTTAVVEVLLARVRPYQLLAGTVFGIGVVAMLQLVATVAAGLVSLAISGVSVPGDVWIALPAALFWFLAGYLLYSTLFALAGSFVSRQEDAQGAAAPISICFLAAYLLVFTFVNDPSSRAATILSVLPPFAPMLMPLRMATGSASIGEIALGAVLIVAAIYGMLRLAGRIYARTLLRRGSRVRWGEALRLTRRS